MDRPYGPKTGSPAQPGTSATSFLDNRKERETAGAHHLRADQRSGSHPVLADTGPTTRRGEVQSMKKKLFVRVVALASSLAGVLLAGGAGFTLR